MGSGPAAGSGQSLVHPGVVELWAVAEWNDHLFSAVFSGVDESVTYLNVHPAGLTELLGWPSTEDTGQRAIEMLVDAHRPLVTNAGGSVVSAALQTCRDRVWQVGGTRIPPFFSLLWTTCLVAWGHPDVDDGDFASRWRTLFSVEGGGVQPSTSQRDVATARELLGRNLAKVEIIDLWELTARWLADSPDHRNLVLPQPAGHERHVGTSYALSQPDLRERRWLARAVTALDVAGYDPPPGPVLESLSARALYSAPSDEFSEQLKRLVDLHRSGGRLHDDPVWAAIRRECIAPVTTAGGVVPISALSAVLEDFIDGVDGHIVWKGDDEPPAAPEQSSWKHDPLSDEHFLEGASSGGQLWSFLESPWEAPRTGLARLVREGLVCFARDERARFGVVTGAEVANAAVVLVRDDLAAQLFQWVGGSTEWVPASGWTLVRGASLQSVTEDRLPKGFEAVRQLVRTTAPPTARWVGGVRVGPGTYFRHLQLLPAVSAPEARAVVDETRGAHLQYDEARWSFDPETPPGGLHVRVIWPAEDTWPDTVLRARFEDGAVHPPKTFTSEDHVLIGPETPPICDGDVGLQARHGSMIRLGYATATTRHAGAVAGSIDASPQDAILTHYGHPGRQLFSVLHDSSPKVTGKVTNPSARRKWRHDVTATGRGRNVLSHDGRLLDHDHPALVTLRQATTQRDLPTVELDEPDAAVLLHQLQRAYSSPESRRTADELLAVTCVDLGRRSVSRKDHLDMITQLTTARDGITTSMLFSLLRANAEAGRFELALHRARPAVELMGVQPRLRWAMVASLPAPKRGVFEGALVGLVESSTAQRIRDDLASFADTRWLTATTLPQESGHTDRLVAPVLKLLTDEPKYVNEVAKRHLGGRLGAPGVLAGVPQLAPFVPSAKADRPGGFDVADSYLVTATGPKHVLGRVDTDGVVVERLRAATRSDVYTVVADGEVVYTNLDRDWAATRAAELAGVPLFGRCRHGILRSRSTIFSRLPMPVGRALLAHGFGLASSTFDRTGRLATVTYPFGRGASALDGLPESWIDPEDCTCMTL